MDAVAVSLLWRCTNLVKQYVAIISKKPRENKKSWFLISFVCKKCVNVLERQNQHSSITKRKAGRNDHSKGKPHAAGGKSFLEL